MSRPLLAVSAAATFIAVTSGASAQQAPGTTPLQEIAVEGRAQGSGNREGQGAPGVATNDGYVAKNTRTGTKTERPINEVPQTINTVTQKQLQDRNPQDLKEALDYTPGVTTGNFGFDPRYDSFFIRGVDVTYTGVFRDGLRQFNSPNGIVRLEPYGLESISILKGPSSALYGASSSAGLVDLISKRPTDYKFGEIELQSGSFDRIQGAFDIGGPANDQGTILWRLTGLARDSDTELSSVRDDRVFIAPAVTFRPNDDTKFTLLAEYMDATTGGGAAYQNNYSATGDSLGAIDIPLASDDFNDFNQKQGRIGYELEHRFNDFVTLHQNVRYSALQTRQEYNGTQPLPLLGITRRDSGLLKEHLQGGAADTYLETRVMTGPVGHRILTGVDASLTSYRSRQAFGTFTDPDDIPTPDFDANSDFPRRYRQSQSLVGVYVQDELELQKWRLTLSGRHDWFDSDYRSNLTSALETNGIPGLQDDEYFQIADRQKQNKGKFTGRAGLSYVTDFGLTPYVGYGTSFVPNPGTVIGGGVAKPTSGEQAEAGLKYAFPDVNASLNASLFYLKQDDGLVFAVVNGTNALTALDFTNKGFELDGTATLANGVSIQANYSYVDTEIRAPVTLDGKEITGIPNHTIKVWAGYDFITGAARGLSLGAGVRYTGSSFGDNANRSVIKNSPRAFVDAKIAYELENVAPSLKGVRLQVNATNLLDDVKQICVSNYCYYDKGRQVIASVRYRW